MIYAFMVAARSPQWRMPGGINKWVWAAFTLLVPVLGAVIFLLAFYLSSAGGTSPSETRTFTARGGQRPSGPIAPDDDPDFLKKLDEELRRQAYDKRLDEHERHDHSESEGEAGDSRAESSEDDDNASR